MINGWCWNNTRRVQEVPGVPGFQGFRGVQRFPGFPIVQKHGEQREERHHRQLHVRDRRHERAEQKAARKLAPRSHVMVSSTAAMLAARGTIPGLGAVPRP